MTDGFLGRWAKRKHDVQQGKAVEAEPVLDEVAVPPPQPLSSLPPPPGEGGGGGIKQPPPPTLEDVHALTPESDFKRFAAADVSPEVKNAAMKKLFSDPHYNVMDGMDVYIDDYSRPDPIPYPMLRQLASAKFLNLFHQEEKEEAEAAEAAARARDDADNPAAQSVAQSPTAPQAVPEAPDHADPDLRLQQDHAAAGKEPGRGTG